MASPYPALGYYFKVDFNGLSSADIDSKFMEVSGLDAELEVEQYSQGGDNSTTLQLPLRTKFPNLVLKRGLPSENNSVIIQWAREGIYDFLFVPCSITVTLLHKENNDSNDVAKPLRAWALTGAYPVKLQYSALNAMKAEIVIETLELAYRYARPL